MSTTVPTHLAGYFSPATMLHKDRRGTTERRMQKDVKPLAEPESSWGRHVLLAGFLGVVLGATGVIAALAQGSASYPEQSANVATARHPVAALTLPTPLFDATPAVSALAATTDPVAVEAAAGAESYSEDAAGVPGATYREPPARLPVASRPLGNTAR